MNEQSRNTVVDAAVNVHDLRDDALPHFPKSRTRITFPNAETQYLKQPYSRQPRSRLLYFLRALNHDKAQLQAGGIERVVGLLAA